MRTRELRNDSGIITGFSVSSALLTRWGVTRVVQTIPGVKILRKQKLFRLAGPDDFCEFMVEGEKFLAIEPFGNNSEFWIVADPPEKNCTQIGIVKNAFSKQRFPFGWFAT